MRRTNSRSSRTRANGARRASSSRSRSARSKRPSRPHLTQLQVREITGVLLILVGLLGMLAVATHAGSILAGLQEWLTASFGRAWFVPVIGAVALGAYMLWPQAPRPRLLDVLAGAVAVIALIGLFGLAAHAGGAAGRSIDAAVVGLAGEVGAWALLVAALVIGLIVTIHFSPGALIGAVLNTGQAAYAERRRLDRLVAAPGEPAKNAAKAASVKVAPVADTEPVGPAYPPVAAAALRSWEVEADREDDATPAPNQDDREPDEEPEKPVLRVIAAAEHDIPEIEWKRR